jgi:ATPase subunit of ABC transporter with duplicated ATPase domains
MLLPWVREFLFSLSFCNRYFSQHSVEALSTAPEVGSSQITALSYFLKHFADKGEKIEESEARQCLGAVGLQGKVAASTPLVQLSGGQKV